ncbi:MAG: chromosome segregation protein SMC [Desulfuromonadales bacterium]|nr:chromosome segregation protein SMC [Desulfuromonadales bacterium]
MKIKRLEITGFKSFVERTILDFDAGITSIVGPNGCGKSNIVDAIRWVMGEQSARHLRGKTMEDVIFGGSENRKPFGMAEVALIMDNADGACPTAYRDYAEIQICRRLYRNGDSEYLINKTPCRLLDISELFMDTGVGNRAYSIIEQGKIGMIVNARPEERRSLIEEAAGVTKFKSRKKSALRKIEATEQNLLRLNDIVGEVRRQMNSLKRQAQRAEKFREFREELRAIDLQLALREFRALTARIEETGAATASQAERLEIAQRQLEQADLELERKRLAHLDHEKATTTAQEQVHALTGDIQKVESRLEFAGRETENLAQQQGRIAEERADIERRLADSGQEGVDLERLRSEQAQAAEAEKARLAEAEDRLQRLLAEEAGRAESLEQARTQLYHLLSDLSRLNSRQEEAERRVQSLAETTARNRQEALTVQAQCDRLAADRDRLHGQLAGAESERDQLVGRRDAFEKRRQQLQQEIEQLEADLLGQRAELSRQSSRLESLQQLEKSLAGYGRGVKAVLAEASLQAGMQGLVADFLEVPPHYEAAVEAALGERVQALLPKESPAALAALAFLREREGRCTFLLSETPAPPEPQFSEGTPLAELVASPRQPTLAGRLFAGVFLVTEVTAFAGRSLPAGVVLVSEDGTTLNDRGELTGGGRQLLDRGLLHKKREIRELGSSVKTLESVVAELNRRRDDLSRQRADGENGLRTVQEQLYRMELQVAESRKDIDGLDREKARLHERLEVLSLEEEQLHAEHQSLGEVLEQTATGRADGEQRKEAQEQLVARLTGESRDLRSQVERLQQQVTTLKVSLAGLLEREESARNALERAERLREELGARREALARQRLEAVTRTEGLATETRELRMRLDVLYSRRREAQEKLDRQRDAFEESRRCIDEDEQAIRQLRQRVGNQREQLTRAEMQSRELELESEHLRQAFLERQRVDLADDTVQALYDIGFDESGSQQRRAYLRNRIDEIGEVNLMAIEEFQELEERYGFLTGQQEDLQQSLDGLRAAIGKINRTTRKRFAQTFDQVNEQFRRVFPRLFNGGQAELRLTDENDLLETGIEIVAQPPGKKLQNVTLLSGGEKALTAVALIFSIFLIKPSPFCLLDEVDAPLDDANIGRFNDMVREMADAAQFIIITHNKRTMEIADNLYGVTMEEPGVSKMVSVQMREVA